LLAAAVKSPVSVMETAGEGGPWGMALLAAYRVNKKEGQTLESYLSDAVFANAKSVTVYPDAQDEIGMDKYTDRFICALDAQKAAVEKIN
ncbi:MAG: ATPase, partial [Clostridia bacterium]|nr:ATPase [Clostridia bacterium]